MDSDLVHSFEDWNKLEIPSEITPSLKEENRTSLQKDLLALVKRFMIPPELISTAIDIAAIVSWLESGASKGTAPQTPNKKNKTTEDKIDTEVDLTVYHQKLDDWAVEIIGNIDAELGTIHILRNHL